MNKSEFTRFLAGACPEARIALDSHDTAQREALARVEAERDDWKSQASGLEKVAKDNAETANTAQAQLAEALTLIRDAKEGLRTGPSYGWEDRLAAELGDFLSRHAQAEQQKAQEIGPLKGAFDEAAEQAFREQYGLQEAQGAQAGEFQREDRYIVIKRKDLGAVPLEVRESLGVALFQLSKHLPKRKCLVIESDWPEYEPTWAAIQARVTCQGGDERSHFEKWFFETNNISLDEYPHWNARDELGEYRSGVVDVAWGVWQARAALATQHAVQWIACSDRLPEVPEGCQQEFIVCAKRNQSGKLVVMSALYLNAYPLYCDYDNDEADEDGNIPHTGWYDAKSNGDDANCYSEIDDSRCAYGAKVAYWMPLPQPAAVRGAEHE